MDARSGISLVMASGLMAAALYGSLVPAEAAKKPSRTSSVKFQCPKGALKKGGLPPKGYEVWCEKRVRLKGKAATFDTVKHGPHLIFYRTGQLWKRGFFRLGRRHGKFTTYWVSGKKQEEMIFRNGKATGAYAIYRLDGSVWQKGNFVNGKREGKIAYYESVDRVPIICGVKSGIPNRCISRYKNGKTKYQVQFAKGLATGTEILNYPNGKVFAKRSHSRGMPLGNAELYHGNGKKGLEVSCKGGKIAGAPKEWNAEGKPISPRLSERIASSLCQPVARNVAHLSETLLVHYFPTLRQ